MFTRFCAQTFQISDSGINWEVADKPNKRVKMTGGASFLLLSTRQKHGEVFCWLL